MYDTQFIQNTFQMKNKIIHGEFSNDDQEKIENFFEKHRNTQPKVYNIETTNYCNMTCIMCQRTTDMQKPLQHMSDQTFETIINQLEPQKEDVYENWQEFVDQHLRQGDHGPSENNYEFDVISRTITLHNFGEPLIDPHLPKRIEALNKKSIPFYFSCNPCNIKLKQIAKIFDAGAGYIKFAMDSLDDEEAKKIRGRHADFTESYKKVLQVLNLKEKMNAKTEIVLTMLNMGEPEQGERFLELWKDKGVFPYVKTLDNKWLLKNKGEIEKSQVESENYLSEQYCEFAWLSMTILADGSVVPCTQDINGIWTFGNVNEQSLVEIWNSEKYQEFRRMQLSKETPKSFMCHGKCDLNIVSDFYKQ